MSASDFEGLGRHVGEKLDGRAAPDDALRSRLAERALGRNTARAGRTLGWRAPALACFGAALAALVVVVVLRRPSEIRELSFEVGARRGVVGEWIAPVGQAGVSLRFSEGSRVALDPGSRAKVTRLDARGAEVVLSSGLVHADVVPRPGNAWRVRTGPFAVDVKGTRFDVAWDEKGDRFELDLYEGRVVVSGCSFGAGRRVSAGQRARASCRVPTVEVGDLTEREKGDKAGPSAAVAPTPGVAPLAVERAPSAGRLQGPAADASDFAPLARGGHYDRAYALALAEGLDAVRAGRSADDVLLLGETARLTGHPEEARASYQAVRRRFGASAAAARAAFDLGRLEAGAGRAALAAPWFQAYLDEQPAGPLASAALGRLLEARVELGNQAAAKDAARAYLARYPTGPHADAARKVLGRDAHGGPE